MNSKKTTLQMRCLRVVAWTAVIIAGIVFPPTLGAQQTASPGNAASRSALAAGGQAGGPQVLVGAYAGQPYGVATIEIPLAAPIVGRTPPPLDVRDQAGRIMFPIADDVRVKVAPPSQQPVPEPGRGRLLGRLGQLIREIASDAPEAEQIVSRRISFLFRGESPMAVRLREGQKELGTYQIVPQNDPAARSNLLASWWQSYTSAAKRQIDAGDYPPWVENYLVAMLSGRTGRPLPLWYSQTQQDDDQLIATLKLLFGAEGVSEEVFRKTASGSVTQLLGNGKASLPVPDPPRWVPSTLPEIDPSVVVEPIATRVPAGMFLPPFR